MQDLFTGCAGADCDVVITFRGGRYSEKAHYSRYIIIHFLNWQAKAKVLETFRDYPNMEVNGQVFSIFPDTIQLYQISYLSHYDQLDET